PRAAARLGAPAPSRRARRDQLPLARGPAREELHRRARARLRVPPRAARVRMRSRVAREVAHPSLDRALAGRARAQPALGICAAARREKAERGRGRGLVTPPATAAASAIRSGGAAAPARLMPPAAP